MERCRSSWPVSSKARAKLTGKRPLTRTLTRYYEALAKGNSKIVSELEKKLEIFAEYGSAYKSLTENLEFEREQLALLRAKYEETKADATEALTTKFVVNKAYPSEKKAYPIRWLIVVVSTFSAFLIAVLSIIGIENFKRFKQSA